MQKCEVVFTDGLLPRTLDRLYSCAPANRLLFLDTLRPFAHWWAGHEATALFSHYRSLPPVFAWMGPYLTVVHVDRKEEGWEISLCSGWPASSGTLLADGREGGVTNGRSLGRKSALPASWESLSHKCLSLCYSLQQDWARSVNIDSMNNFIAELPDYVCGKTIAY